MKTERSEGLEVLVVQEWLRLEKLKGPSVQKNSLVYKEKRNALRKDIEADTYGNY